MLTGYPSESDPVVNVTEALANTALRAPVEPLLPFPDNQAQGQRRRELLEQAMRGEMNRSEVGQRKEKRKKRSESPASTQPHRPKSPPPPPPPAAGPSRTPRSLPYDPARAQQ